MNITKIKTYMGFAKKMGKLSYGQTVLNDITKVKHCLVILDEGASSNTKDKYISACKAADVKIIELPKGETADAIGKPGVRAVCVKDSNLIKVILENMD